jgi:hypothetical protein
VRKKIAQSKLIFVVKTFLWYAWLLSARCQHIYFPSVSGHILDPWLKENRHRLSSDVWTEPERKRASDGSVCAWRTRLADLNPSKQIITLQTWVQHWQ